MLLRVAWNAFEKGRKNVLNKEEGSLYLYNSVMFSTFVKTRWLNPALDNASFVLVHGDLDMYNLIVNKDLDILAVLD